MTIDKIDIRSDDKINEIDKSLKDFRIQKNKLQNEIKLQSGEIPDEYFDELVELDGIKDVYKTKEELKIAINKNVSRLEILSDIEFGGRLSFFIAYVESVNLEKVGKKRKKYNFESVGGMNVSDYKVLKMFNDRFKDIDFDENGNIIGGEAKFSLDVWNEGSVKVKVDFEKKTIKPDIFVDRNRKINVDQLSNFIKDFMCPNNGRKALFVKNNGEFIKNPERNDIRIDDNQTSNSIYISAYYKPKLRSKDWIFETEKSTITHEIRHALYDGDPSYKKMIFDNIRRLDDKQKESMILALMFMSKDNGIYDILDKDTDKISKDLVLQEIGNSQFYGGNYNYNLGDIKVSKNNLLYSGIYYMNTNTDDIKKFESDNFIKFYGLKNNNLELSKYYNSEENSFNIISMLDEFKTKEPEFYQKIQELKKVFIDDVIN